MDTQPRAPIDSPPAPRLLPPFVPSPPRGLARRTATALMLAGIFLVLTAGAAAAAEKLPALGVASDQTSVSGISSGGAMAVQFGVVHSSIVTGVGVVAGAPYSCAANDVATARSACMAASQPIDVPRLVERTRQRAADSRIDPLASLARQRVWLFGGGSDSVVRPPVYAALNDYYRSLVPAAQVKAASIGRAEHSMPTPGFGNPCGTLGEPFISKCATESPDHADAAGELLNWIYPSLMPPAVTLSGRLVEFDQSEFINAPQSHSMNDTAWIYVPEDCFTSTGCRVHVALHGCLQYPRHEYFADGQFRKIGKTFVEHAGYNRWADTNRIVVLYPQANARPLTPWELWMPWRYKRANPKGCWDWWGYDGDSYDTRDGTQIRAIRRMIDRLTAPASR